MGLTEKDKALISEARSLDPIDWGYTNHLREQADTEEAREMLYRIGTSLYHREEGDLI